MSNNEQSRFNRHDKIRAGVALLATAGAIGYNPIKNSIESAGDNIHQANESSAYKKTDLYDHLKEGKITLPGKPVAIEVKSGDTDPLQFAQDIHAKDPILVSDEVSVQVGGADDMNVGETVVLPLDQIEKQQQEAMQSSAEVDGRPVSVLPNK